MINKSPMYKFLIWFCFLTFICIIGISNVFAYTYEDIGYLNNQTGVQVEVAYNGQPLPLTLGNEYYLYQVYSIDIFVSNINWSPDNVYQFELFTPGTILTNANKADVIWYSDNNTSGTCTTLTTKFDNEYPQLTFKCNTQNDIKELYIKYYNSNNQFLFDNSYFKWVYSYARKRISSDTDNTGEIKDALNQQTQDIINNQNSNTDRIIEDNKKNFQTCRDSYNLWNSNQVWTNGTYAYFKLPKENTKYYIKVKLKEGKTSPNDLYLRFTDTGYFYNNIKIKDIIRGGTIINTTNELNNEYLSYISIYPNSYKDTINEYYEFMLSEKDVPYEEYGEEICSNKLDEQTNAINGLNDSLNDDNTDGATSEASDFFSDFNTNTFGLTSIITAPLNLIQSLTSKSCTPLHLPLPYLSNKYLDLPCMSTIYSQHFGTFFTLYQTITYGIIAYWVCVRIFNHVKDFKNPEHDEIEVVDL